MDDSGALRALRRRVAVGTTLEDTAAAGMSRPTIELALEEAAAARGAGCGDGGVEGSLLRSTSASAPASEAAAPLVWRVALEEGAADDIAESDQQRRAGGCRGYGVEGGRGQRWLCQ
jgi:hypothetical protein